MSNVTMEALNAGNNPEDFGGELVTPANADGMELWQFGNKFAARWHQSSWNGFGIPWDDQIPLA